MFKILTEDYCKKLNIKFILGAEHKNNYLIKSFYFVQIVDSKIEKEKIFFEMTKNTCLNHIFNILGFELENFKHSIRSSMFLVHIKDYKTNISITFYSKLK